MTRLPICEFPDDISISLSNPPDTSIETFETALMHKNSLIYDYHLNIDIGYSDVCRFELVYYDYDTLTSEIKDEFERIYFELVKRKY